MNKFVICTTPETLDEEYAFGMALLDNGYDLLFVSDFKDLDIARWSNGEFFLYHGSLEFAQYVNRFSNAIKVFTPEKYAYSYWAKKVILYNHYINSSKSEFRLDKDLGILANVKIPMLNNIFESPLTGGLLELSGDQQKDKESLEIMVKWFADESGRVFIRPNSGMKEFSGMVFINKEPYWSNDLESTKAFKCDALVIAEPKDIEQEWRFMVCEGIVSGCQYKDNHRLSFIIPRNSGDVFKNSAILDNSKEVRMLAHNVFVTLYDYMDKAYTIDICKTKTGEYYLLEINSFVSAGLYNMNYDAIAKALKLLYKEKDNG
jgi:hypothetical protein